MATCGRWQGFLASGFVRACLALVKNDPALVEPCGPWEVTGKSHIYAGRPSERCVGTIYVQKCAACGTLRDKRVMVERP